MTRLMWRGLLGLALLNSLVVAGVAAWWYWPRAVPAVYAENELPPQDQGLRVSWWGVSAILLQDDETALFIDPFFSRPEGVLAAVRNQPISPHPGRIAAGLQQAGVDRLAAVLVSHSHYDHAMDAGVVANLTGAQLLGSASTLNIGRGAGMAPRSLVAVETGRDYRFGAFTIRFLPSRHAGATGGRPAGDITEPLRPPATYLDYRMGGAYSILISHPEGTLLHHGSAGFLPGALREVQADIMLMGVALIDDLAGYLQNTADLVGATHLIPIHWDNFLQPLDEPLRPMPVGVDLERWFGGVAALRPGLQIHTLRLGRSSALPPAKTPAADAPHHDNKTTTHHEY